MKMSLLLVFAIIVASSCTGLRLLEDTTHNSKAIRCFWMETESFRVFDLKGLKRIEGQKLYFILT